MAPNTLIFGPTGGVASFALQHAASKGSHVTLAMRNTSKAIGGLSSAQESSGSFTRVQADLTDASSVAAAAKQSQAHSAFIYLIQGPQGTPRASIQALKDGGVRHVVFLSSFSVSDPIRSITPDNFIGFAHAQVEISLEEVFGEGNFTAVRPAFFNSNVFRFAGQIKTGVVRDHYPTVEFDFNAPSDIGSVVGELLVREGPLPRAVDICGPKLIPLDQALKIVATKVHGREIEVKHVDEEEAVGIMKESGLPEPIARHLAKGQRSIHNGERNEFRNDRFVQGQKTVPHVLGRDAVSFEQWVEENKAAFA